MAKLKSLPQADAADDLEAPSLKQIEETLSVAIGQMPTKPRQETALQRLCDQMMEVMRDPVAAALLNKDQFLTILQQLVLATRGITGWAEALEVEYAGNKVVKSDDFGIYNSRRLHDLIRLIDSYIQVNIREKTAAIEERDLALKNLIPEQERIAKIEQLAKDNVSVADGKVDLLQQQVVALNRILANHQDVDCYAVTKIDTVTRKALKFYNFTDGKIRSVPLSRALIVEEGDARELRSDVVRALRTRIGRVESLNVSDEIVVMRVALSEIALVDDDDSDS